MPPSAARATDVEASGHNLEPALVHRQTYTVR